MKTWNLGNTTVRNPERIRAGLRLIKEKFEGRVFDLETQRELFEALLAANLIEGNPSDEANRAASGRKWQGACYKLGFLNRSSRSKGIISITDAGKALLSDDVVESDIFLRQMLKVQLPAPTERTLEGAAIHPFYVVLSTAVSLKQTGMGPLSKDEIALFLQSANRDDQVPEILEAIKSYRTIKDGIDGSVAKRRFFRERRAAKAKSLGLEEATLNDYSDTTARYSVITGIFTFGGQQTLVIKEDQMNLAQALVDAGPSPLQKESDFWSIFQNPNLPLLPTDDDNFLKQDIGILADRLNELSTQVDGTAVARPATAGLSTLQLKRQRKDLEQQLILKKEIQFYRSQSSAEQIEDIKELFESINARELIGGSDYRPAWAEWGVWRVFLSINSLTGAVSDTRGFRINSELFPVHHAKGGAADMLFRYEGGTIVPVEVTLNEGERQFTTEGVPVRFHIKSVVERNLESEVIAVFAAPSIHAAAAHEFLKADYYSEQLQGVLDLEIIPLTFIQLQSFLPGQKNACHSGEALLDRLKSLLSLKSNASDGPTWLRLIGQELAC